MNKAITTLGYQVKSLEVLVQQSEAKVLNVRRQIAERENKIDLLEGDILNKKEELENQKKVLGDYLELLYIQQNAFYDKNSEETKNISLTKILFQNSSTGEVFQEIEYFNILEQTGEQILYQIKDTRQILATNIADHTKNKKKLTQLRTQLEKEENQLRVQKDAKDQLLKQTQGEEEIYRELLAQSKLQQLNTLNEVNTLRDNLELLEEKILEEGEDFDPDKYPDLINPNVKAIYEFEINSDYTESDKFNWPVNPSRGISAFFQESSYKATFGIPHNAIDIPTTQGTLIKAPAAGVVYKVQDNGTGYSYIMLAHKGGLMTLYGHVSGIMVEEREVVLAGEVIGLSGGIPGTKGSGYLTTGAHLHFELLKNGKYIDPLLMLPLDKLPIFGDEEEEETDEAVE